MPDLVLTPVDNGFPVNFSGTLEQFKDAIIQYTTLTVDADSVVEGRVGGAAPTDHTIPWLDGRVWKAWDGSAWTALDVIISNGGHNVELSAATLTADRDIIFPNKDGTVALTADLFGATSSMIIPGTNIIDWSESNNFYRSISANTTFTFKNSVPGQEIAVIIVATGSYTTTFPANWSGSHAQTASGTDLYIFKNVAGVIYGRQLADMS